MMAQEPRRGSFREIAPEKQRQIASQGGNASPEQRVGHEWTPEKAREAGRKGGLSTERRKRP
jgi:general stress protein YciG